MIAIVSPQFYGVHGIARYLDSFLANLPADHPPIYMISGDEFHSPRSYPGVEIIDIPFSTTRYSLFTWGWAVRKLLLQLHAENKIQWVNFHFPPLIPGLLLPKSIPMVLTAHTTYLGMSGRFYEERHFQSQWSNLSLLIKSWMERRIFGSAQKVITLTEQGRQEVLRYGYQGPVTVIPNGADINLFTPDDAVVKDIDVLFCGRIERRKGSRAMVELCRLLTLKQPDVKIVIVGYGDDDAYVQAGLADYAANVTLAGKTPFSEMINYYRRSKVYASTSYYEGLPGTCLEAMAMQLPVAVWNFLFYEGIVIDGETGFYAAPNDYETLAGQIMQLLADPQTAAAMGRNGRTLIQEQYGWRKLAAEILTVFA